MCENSKNGDKNEFVLFLRLFHYNSLFFIICLLVYLKENIGDLLMKFKQQFSSNSSKKEDKMENNSSNSGNLSKFQARLLLITCAMMYGSNFVGTKMLQETLAPSMITTLRFFIGSLFFLEPLLKFEGDMNVIKGGIELVYGQPQDFLYKQLHYNLQQQIKMLFYVHFLLL